MSDQIRAVVDIAAHGKSSGDSVQSLMANLDGSIGAVMGEGYLTKYLDLLSINLSQKVIHFWGRHKKGGEIRCAVVQFDIKNGIATSRAFVFDTEAGVLSGEGDINLGTEQVNFLLVPKPKHLSLSFSTKLRVSLLGLLAPFVRLGAYEKHPCDIQDIGQLEQKISTNE